MVTERFQVDWATVLVSSFSTIVIRFDGHGSGFQGTNLLHKVRQRLGELEERDQLVALRSDFSTCDLDLNLERADIFLSCVSFSGSYPKSLTLIRLEWEYMER